MGGASAARSRIALRYDGAQGIVHAWRHPQFVDCDAVQLLIAHAHVHASRPRPLHEPSQLLRVTSGRIEHPGSSRDGGADGGQPPKPVRPAVKHRRRFVLQDGA